MYQKTTAEAITFDQMQHIININLGSSPIATMCRIILGEQPELAKFFNMDARYEMLEKIANYWNESGGRAWKLIEVSAERAAEIDSQ